MATIETGIGLQDNFSSNLQQWTSGISQVTGSMQVMQNVSVNMIDTTALDHANACLERMADALMEVQAQIQAVCKQLANLKTSSEKAGTGIVKGFINQIKDVSGLMKAIESFMPPEVPEPSLIPEPTPVPIPLPTPPRSIDLTKHSDPPNHPRVEPEVESDLQSEIEPELESESKASNIPLKVAVILTAASILEENLKEDIQRYYDREQEKMKLQDVMETNMQGGAITFDAVLNTMALEEQAGVISDELQMQGATQLVGYVQSPEALQELIPVMNDLAAKQYGADVSGQNLIDTSNLLGEAMSGSTDALKTVGITSSQAQQAFANCGSEEEKAAMLAQAVTNSIGDMNSAVANTPQGRIQQMTNSFDNMKEEVGAKMYPAVLQLFSVISDNIGIIEPLIMGIANVLMVVGFVIDLIAQAVGMVASFFSDNWSIIEPIIWGIVAALAAYYLISNLASIAMAVYAAVNGIAAGVVSGVSTAVGVLSGALLACPLAWIIGLVLLLIGVFYGVIAAINHFTGSSLSATGCICGAFAVAGGAIANIVLWVVNKVIELFAALYNKVASIVEFFANLFTDPISTILRQFGGLGEGILGVLEKVAQGIDWVFGSNLAATVASWKGTLKGMIAEAENKEKVTIERMNAKDYTLEYVNLENQWNSGYSVGQDVDNAVKNFDLQKTLFGENNIPGIDSLDKGINTDDLLKRSNGLDNNSAYNGLQNTGANNMINNGTSGIDNLVQNTGDTASGINDLNNGVTATEEDLVYLRDVAEMDAINRFTTAEIKVDMKNTNTINSELDLDGITNALASKVEEQMAISAEGVHY